MLSVEGLSGAPNLELEPMMHSGRLQYDSGLRYQLFVARNAECAVTVRPSGPEY